MKRVPGATIDARKAARVKRKLNWLIVARFWSSVDVTQTKRQRSKKHWLWNGTKDRSGYGRFYIDSQDYSVPATWVAAILAGEKLRNGQVPDHKCRTPSCVNPAHLELVHFRQNILRGIGPTAINARKTKCPSGHAYSKHGLINNKGSRYCGTCDRLRRRESWRKKHGKGRWVWTKLK